MTVLYIYLIMGIIVKNGTFGVLEQVGRIIHFDPCHRGGGGGWLPLLISMIRIVGVQFFVICRHIIVVLGEVEVGSHRFAKIVF